jgi:Fe-S-cluster containining protein
MSDFFPSLVANCHERFDTELPRLLDSCRERGGKFYCAAACADCCTLNVGATLAEAAVIATRLDSHQVMELDGYRQRLAQAVAISTTLKDFLGRHRGEVGPCPFLGADRCCLIYPSRPLACRALLSTRNHAWCGVDFTDLHPGERQAFLSSLDLELVSYPTHYLAAPQELARSLEQEFEEQTMARFGFSLRGNLPLLVHLCRELELTSRTFPPLASFKALLTASGLAHPYVVTLSD